MLYRILFCCLFIPTTLLAQQFKEVALETSINRVTVYLENAQVNRGGTVTVPAGQSTVLVKGLSPYLDNKSIQVQARGNFTVLSVNHQLDYLTEQQKDVRIDSLLQLINELETNIAQKNNRLTILKEKESLLNANKKLGGENIGISLTQLQQALAFYDRQLTEITGERLAVNQDLEAMTEQKNRLEKQLADVRGQEDLPDSQVAIRVDAPNQTPGNFTIRYLVQRAGWKPVYDVRVKDLESPVSLLFKAEVYQNTAVNWNNVQLRFSNGNPNLGGEAPELQTYYIDFFRPEPKTRQSDQRVKSLQESFQPRNAAGVQMSSAARAEADRVVTTATENQTTLEYVVEEPYTIDSGGDNLSVDLNQYELQATYEYYAAPKLDRDAFLIAYVPNWNTYQLLQGKARLFFEETFVGESTLEAQTLNDTLDLSLGRDQRVVIERKKVDDFTQKRFLGSNQVESRGYKITVRNRKSQPVTINVSDQLPVSRNSDIEVTATELSGGKRNTQTGEVSWELDIPAGEQQELTFGYEVKYPKKERVILE